MNTTGRHCYEFGPFRLDPTERVLTRDGRPVPLTLKAFDTLLVLVENSGRLVTKEHLLKTVWRDSFVGDGVLSVNIFNLRKALGTEAGAEPFIETVPRRGYRFAAGVRAVVEESAVRRPPSAISTLAVLPFKTLSADRSDEYLGLGLADALIMRLSKIQRLIVRPTSVVRKYTSLEQDAAEVARRLMVEAVLEGSIRQAGDRIRILIQLVSAREGATLWAEQFDEQFTDIFRVEDQVSEQVTRALLRQLSSAEQQQLSRRATASSEAWRLYLQGRYFWNKRTEAALQKGVAYFQQALELDPHFALAWAGLADSELLGASASSPKEAMPKAKAAVTRALELDDSLGEAHASLARIRMSFDWDWAGAEREFKRALELNPNYATGHQWYANYLLAVGRIEEALDEIARACEIEPFSLMLNCARGWVYYMSRQYDRALEQYRRTLEMESHFVMAWREIALVYEQQGKYEKALAAIRRAISEGGEKPIVLCILGHILALAGELEEARKVIARLSEWRQRAYLSPQLIAVIHAALGEQDQALEGLWRAYEDHSSPLMWLKVDPLVDGLRDAPRFADLLRRVGLAR
jgi:TolB-like protein/Tfp pilus assembly protein PilF